MIYYFQSYMFLYSICMMGSGFAIAKGCRLYALLLVMFGTFVRFYG